VYICQSYKAQSNWVKAGTSGFLMIFKSGTSELKKIKSFKEEIWGLFVCFGHHYV